MGTLKFTNDGIEGETQDILDFMTKGHLTPSTFFHTTIQNRVKWYYFALELVVFVGCLILMIYTNTFELRLTFAVIALVDTFIVSTHLQRHYGQHFYFFVSAVAGILIIAVAFGCLTLAEISDMTIDAARNYINPTK